MDRGKRASYLLKSGFLGHLWTGNFESAKKRTRTDGRGRLAHPRRTHGVRGLGPLDRRQAGIRGQKAVRLLGSPALSRWWRKSRGPTTTPASPVASMKKADDLTRRQQAELAWIQRVNQPLYRAYLLKEHLRQIFQRRRRSPRRVALLGGTLPAPPLRGSCLQRTLDFVEGTACGIPVYGGACLA